MPKGVYDRSKRKNGGVAEKAIAPLPPVIVGPVATVGRWCSRCQTVRPFDCFAPSSEKAARHGILNWICRVCDGSYAAKLDAEATMQAQLAAYATANDQLRSDIGVIAEALRNAEANTQETDLLQRQIADLTFQIQEAEDAKKALAHELKLARSVRDRAEQRPVFKPLNERAVPPVPDGDEPVVIPRDARPRIELFPIKGGRYGWIAKLDETPLGGGDDDTRDHAHTAALQWIEAHREGAAEAQASETEAVPELEAAT